MQWIKVFTDIFANPKSKYYSKNVMGTHFLEYGFNY